MNRKEFLDILRLAGKRLVNRIICDGKFPSKDKCGDGKYYKLLYDMIEKLDLKSEYLVSAELYYGRKVSMESAMKSSAMKQKVDEKLNMLKELKESR